MERRLFEDGGYYLDNGASLCEPCHLKAEQTLITPEELREKIGIQKRVLPPHLYSDYIYDKWGNIVNNNGTRVKGELFEDESVQKILKAGNVLDSFLPYVKYPRTFHLPFSEGRTDDDRVMKDLEGLNRMIVVTSKMDGENTTGYWNGYIHARSMESGSHPSRNWVKNFLTPKLFELPYGWRICGENLYAKHSIHYKDLTSLFQVFSIWDEKNYCLSWDETLEWCELLELTHVPELYFGPFSYGTLADLGQECEANKETQEGFVVRVASQFHYSTFSRSVAKYVRKNHVQTNKHWIKTAIVRNETKT